MPESYWENKSKASLFGGDCGRCSSAAVYLHLYWAAWTLINLPCIPSTQGMNNPMALSPNTEQA